MLHGGCWEYKLCYSGATYTSPADIMWLTFAFKRPGDITTGWSKNQRDSFGMDAGLTWQRGDHESELG